MKPLLLIDIDGVISLFGFDLADRPRGAFHSIDGILHFLSADAGAHLLELSSHFDAVWCSGWEERANEHLPLLLGLPGPLPFLSFERTPTTGQAHWKLPAIDEHAGARPLAWIDDSFTDACEQWAQARPAPTLLLRTDPQDGLTAAQVQTLVDWSARVGTS